jgi:hypothetical protein
MATPSDTPTDGDRPADRRLEEVGDHIDEARRQAADDGLLSDDEMSETFEDAFPPPVEEPPNADGEQRAPTP